MATLIHIKCESFRVIKRDLLVGKLFRQFEIEPQAGLDHDTDFLYLKKL